ncbi:MAG: LysR family transcriptional regulator [Pseudomonadota bacterium]
MDGINYKHLRYFWEVAREGGIARAANLLNVTPQTVSGQVSRLEKDFGSRLFERSGRKLVLTAAGRTAPGYADEIFQLGDELKEIITGADVGSRPLQLTVGVADVVPKLVADGVPGVETPVRVVCREAKLESLLADLVVHKLDMVLTDTPMPPATHVSAFNHLLGECGVTFLAASATAGAFREEFPQSLHRASMLLPAADTALYGALRQWFQRLGIAPIAVGEFDDSALMKVFGQAGAGVFCAPSVIEREVR